jgi:ribosomal protein S12 methylthiotransferase accessory factor
MFQRDLRAIQLADAGSEIARMEARPADTRLDHHPNRSTDTFEGDVALLLEALRGAGLGQVVALDLTKPEIGIPVARVVVPGLEALNIEFYAPGKRAQAHAARAAA